MNCSLYNKMDAFVEVVRRDSFSSKTFWRRSEHVTIELVQESVETESLASPQLLSAAAAAAAFSSITDAQQPTTMSVQSTHTAHTHKLRTHTSGGRAIKYTKQRSNTTVTRPASPAPADARRRKSKSYDERISATKHEWSTRGIVELPRIASQT